MRFETSPVRDASAVFGGQVPVSGRALEAKRRRSVANGPFVPLRHLTFDY